MTQAKDESATQTTFDDLVRCDDRAERERLIASLVSRMTLPEKIAQMSGSASLYDLAVMLVAYGKTTYDSGENPRLGIPPIKFTDGPRGVCLGHSTCFPVAMARAATWDVPLQERVGSVMGIEARSQGANFFGGVCLNVPRHPGWGRAQETFGEDPYLLGQMAVGTIEGAQRHVMACAKHFACNSMEEARFYVDVQVDERTLREIYLPHFKMCADAGVASVMSAYNKVNGEYCGHNAHLLRDILKDEWGFDGFVMSDFVYGVRDGRKGVLGGLDVEMPYRWRYGWGFKRKVKNGAVPESLMDDAVARVLRKKAEFAEVGEPDKYDAGKVGCEQHAALALEVARESLVLLKNEDNVLPLERTRLKRLAVIGPLSDTANIGDMGSSRVSPPYVVTPLTAIRKLVAGDVDIIYESGRSLDAARSAAGNCDAVVVVVGLTRKDEGEFMPIIHAGGDREDLRLDRKQEDLIKAVAAENDKCVVVMEGGSAIVADSWLNQVAGLVMAWYPGMEGGNAIAEVLFGDFNPTGKLPVTFPASNGQNPPFDRRARSQEYGYYHGYRLFNEKGMKPAFAFGFGLSYTTFALGALSLGSPTMSTSGSISIEADVTNTGELAGSEVVQLYVGYAGSRVDRPVRELKGFSRVTLDPGQTATVSFELRATDLAYYDADRSEWVVEEHDYYAYVGSSSREEDLSLSCGFSVRDA